MARSRPPSTPARIRRVRSEVRIGDAHTGTDHGGSDDHAGTDGRAAVDPDPTFDLGPVVAWSAHRAVRHVLQGIEPACLRAAASSVYTTTMPRASMYEERERGHGCRPTSKPSPTSVQTGRLLVAHRGARHGAAQSGTLPRTHTQPNLRVTQPSESGEPTGVPSPMGRIADVRRSATLPREPDS